jgi:hypothetical protein
VREKIFHGAAGVNGVGRGKGKRVRGKGYPQISQITQIAQIEEESLTGKRKRRQVAAD